MQDPRGVTSLNLLEQALSEGDSHSMTYFAFDLCHLDGHDLSGARLVERKQALEGLIGPLVDARSPIQISDHVDGDGDALFAQASRMGLEGIVSKKADARYVQARSASWLKVKRVDVGSFVVVGFLSNRPRNASSLAAGRGAQRGAGLRLPRGIGRSATRRPAPSTPTFAGRCATRRRSPVPRTPGALWSSPCGARRSAIAAARLNDAPRAPVLFSVAPRRRGARTARAAKPRLVGDRDLAAIHLTNPQRELFARQRRHQARPGALLRPRRRLAAAGGAAPAGDGDPLPHRRLKDLFYQRHAFAGPATRASRPSSWPTRRSAPPSSRSPSPSGYLGLTQFGAVEFHLWGCHIDDPEHPDRLVMDLDPDESLPWARVCDGAEILRDRLQAMGLRPFLRTTGGKGVHLVVALAGGHDWPTVKGFAEALSRADGRREPGPVHRGLLEGAAQGPDLPRLSAQCARRERGGVLFAAGAARLPGGDPDRLGRAAQAVGRRRLQSSYRGEAAGVSGRGPLG